jgi:hypothetical protein
LDGFDRVKVAQDFRPEFLVFLAFGFAVLARDFL